MRDEGAVLGDVYVRRPGGRLERATSFRGTLAGTLREVSDVTTWNTERSLVYHEFAATMFLRLCVFGMDAAAMQGAQAPAGGLERLAEPVEVFAGFGEMPLPDAIAALRYRCERAERLSGIEAFAYRVFSEVDLPRLREIAAKGALSLARIERMGGFYINFDRERTSPEDVAFLISVEAALNRVSCVLDKLGSGLAPVSTSPSEEACAVISSTSRSSCAMIAVPPAARMIFAQSLTVTGLVIQWVIGRHETVLSIIFFSSSINAEPPQGC